MHGHVLNELQEPVGKPGETVRHRPEPGSKIVFLASGRLRADEPVVLPDVLHSERFADLAPAETQPPQAINLAEHRVHRR